MRVGQGIDVHAFSDDADRELWLALTLVPNARGLAGHSDADVATHALCDALLGAAALGDLGRHFSDQDPANKNVASSLLLRAVCDKVRTAGFVVSSADVTIVAETPRLADYLDAMAIALSDAVGTTVSVKATTTEGLGAIGRGEGIAASAVALLEERP